MIRLHPSSASQTMEENEMIEKEEQICAILQKHFACGCSKPPYCSCVTEIVKVGQRLNKDCVTENTLKDFANSFGVSEERVQLVANQLGLEELRGMDLDSFLQCLQRIKSGK